MISKRNKEMVRLYVKNPKMTKTDAYKATHTVHKGTKDYSLHQQASETFRNPLVKSELAKYNGLFEDTLTTTVNRYRDSDKLGEVALAVDVSKWGHDKIHGKATQRSENISTVVSLALDLKDISSKIK